VIDLVHYNDNLKADAFDVPYADTCNKGLVTYINLSTKHRQNQFGYQVRANRYQTTDNFTNFHYSMPVEIDRTGDTLYCIMDTDGGWDTIPPRWISTIVKTIRRHFQGWKRIALIASDVPTIRDRDQDQFELRKDFQLHRALCHHFGEHRVKLYHNQIPLEYQDQCQYVDLFLYKWFVHTHQWLSPLATGKQKDHPGNTVPMQLESQHICYRLSCLNHQARLGRSEFTVLAHGLDCLLTHLSSLQNYQDSKDRELLAKRRKKKHDNLFDSEHVNQIFHNNLQSARDKFKNNNFSHKFRQNLHMLESLELIQKSFCNVVIDDPVFSSVPRLTEKSFKPMMSMRPFLQLGAVGNLQWLRDKGFRTFGQWWDESYDTEPDHWRRIERVYLLAEWIDTLSVSDYQQMLQDMLPVLEHNQQHLKVFRDTTFANLR